ncbi:hypothetical protein DRA42_04315 [Ethanoligenens harbinense]|nr:hypothetical protein CXQ68_04320 [Ethanoligenens harbinense YUAN-3]AYF38191.1 hypothetical protein CXP51_04175 [Ethanoligenens harbinense]AYF40936.1 hypothetical protein CN246_04310 [Ethanoligenens harbinense]QCN91768.1 hypothetical protein DRA42_04315 [Ethanoligenens harbinense]
MAFIISDKFPSVWIAVLIPLPGKKALPAVRIIKEALGIPLHVCLLDSLLHLVGKTSATTALVLSTITLSGAAIQ